MSQHLTGCGEVKPDLQSWKQRTHCQWCLPSTGPGSGDTSGAKSGLCSHDPHILVQRDSETENK